jgi:DHA1 family bicyclomycin/chloramphenicol resistance-like MFS transporter
MHSEKKLSFTTLLMLISFASVNAVLFTPALPDIAMFFNVSTESTQSTVTWFLIGYTIGQLLYGPLANRFGRKPALYFGIGLQIFSCFLCICSGLINQYILLIFARFLLALGSGVGLKMTFTLVNDCYESKIASQKISYLILAFAIAPALGVSLGGTLNTHYGWMSCFYASALYGMILLLRVIQLPETKDKLNYNALKIKNLYQCHIIQLSNIKLMTGGLLMGCSSAFVYVFAALSPFIAIDIFDMDSTEYGIANLLPAIGLIIGSIGSAQLAKIVKLEKIIRLGILMTGLGVLYMLIAVAFKLTALNSIFFPMIFINFGLSFVIANASTVVMNYVSDKSNGSAVMNFINMGTATLVVFSISLFSINTLLLPIVYSILLITMIGTLSKIR